MPDVDLGMPILPGAWSVASEARPARYLADVGRGVVLRVLDLGLACCAVEFAAATEGRPDLLRLTDADPVENGDEGVIDVLVVSGTVTDAMAPVVRRLYDSLPEPRRVMSFGSCANSGGPYWDSYCVTKGVDQLVPVDLYVPGCPPRPEAVLDGLRLLVEEEHA
jgi:NADH-quinone oxidoreductase subunit B